MTEETDETSSDDRFAYKGWAPCMHDEDETRAALAWLDEVLRTPSQHFFSDAFDSPGWGGPIERLLWELNALGATVTCNSDQWVAVSAKGRVNYEGPRIETSVMGDNFLLALADTYRWWREQVQTRAPEPDRA